jgi:hypothetical protein
MLGRRKTTPAATTSPAPNYTVEVVPVFAPDERGAALFHGITNGNASRLNGPVRIDASGEGAWGGWTKAPQVVMTSNRLGGGRPVVDMNTTLDQERGSVLSDPVQRAFTERMATRGRS